MSEGRKQRWTIYSTHPAEEQHLPDPQCTNCDGRGCMGCVLREYDHDCANDCPFCCADNFESTSVEVVPASQLDHLTEGLREEIERAKERADLIEATPDPAILTQEHRQTLGEEQVSIEVQRELADRLASLLGEES